MYEIKPLVKIFNHTLNVMNTLEYLQERLKNVSPVFLKDLLEYCIKIKCLILPLILKLLFKRWNILRGHSYQLELLLTAIRLCARAEVNQYILHRCNVASQVCR